MTHAPDCCALFLCMGCSKAAEKDEEEQADLVPAVQSKLSCQVASRGGQGMCDGWQSWHARGAGIQMTWRQVN